MENVNDNPDLIHNFDSPTNNNLVSKDGLSYLNFFILTVVALILGTTIGFLATKFKKSTAPLSDKAKVQKTVGIADKKTFKDSAEGILKEGGVDGEGNFHLERPGGESQNVYLTSTTVDLSAYIGKKVRVWGATFKAEKAGWLMDVGLVEIL